MFKGLEYWKASGGEFLPFDDVYLPPTWLDLVTGRIATAAGVPYAECDIEAFENVDVVGFDDRGFDE